MQAQDVQYHYFGRYHCAQSHYPPANQIVATSKYVLFPGQNHLLTTGTDDPTLIIT